MDYELQHQKVIDSFLKVLNVNNNMYIGAHKLTENFLKAYEKVGLIKET